ncbi:serine hydrolase [Pseudomonas sp. 10B1]|uniref:serine hydrolase domain-containing protein n=1 Tax=unclassified Pseudomonas TaxID=196821 RepID=UPI002B23674D|nr:MULTISPECIES: serine hydrolase [unclassified Pseudomonas]MEA9978959.1 serine hydrolase [Pseudomonas sp. RTS4]MEA9996316.1 serine hydrolase [Pseudomonas sp. AA4]MEB0085878.1 serine hydrolase [Pseudomonas sp. RTI1]MEB0125797.1 serine hydrolase [Pseudomonas sp. CCC1.2]MEB0154365.1 serine hydrolase [Pseudomonas sp. CCC4.3]
MLTLILWLVATQASGQNWPGERWSVAPAMPSPALQALDDYAFPLRDDVTRKGIRTDALLVIQDGQLVYERYAGVTTADTPHLTWSVSKSVMACVLGVAFAEGRFQWTDLVAKFYPPFKTHSAVRLEDLLHWASGLDWQEDYEYAPLNSSVVAMLYTRGRADMATFTAAHGVASKPGTTYRYSSGDSNVLSAALKTMVGEQAYPNYPWTALFEPLAIHSAVWETDRSGTFVGSSYAYMTARDLARIGLLMQRGGRWGDKQLLPKAWVEFSLAPFAHLQTAAVNEVPGAQWWLNRLPARESDAANRPWPDAPQDAFAALGHWGQAMYVVPSANLVIVRYADDRDGSYRHDQLLKRVLAAFSGEGAR